MHHSQNLTAINPITLSSEDEPHQHPISKLFITFIIFGTIGIVLVHTVWNGSKVILAIIWMTGISSGVTIVMVLHCNRVTEGMSM